MASLDDFDFSVKPTLDELVPDKNEVAPVVSQASNLNLAAYSASLSDDPKSVMDTYSAISSDLDIQGQSEMSDNLVAQSVQKTKNSNVEALKNVLASDEYTDEQKRLAIENTLDETHAQYSARNMTSVKALSDPVEGESARAEYQRIDTASVIQGVNEYKRQQQAVLNRELAKNNDSAIKVAGDVIGYILPFMQQKVSAQVQQELGKGTAESYKAAYTLLGESKLDLREMVEQVPIEDRLAFTETVVAAINASDTIVMPDGNDFARKDYLQSVLAEGGYSDTYRWIDNIVSVLDLTLIGGPLARLVKGAATGTKAAEVATEAVAKVTRRSVKSEVQPTTLSQNFKDTNADKARAGFTAVVSDETGEAAGALYGTKKGDAIANDLLPEIKNADGSVVNKVSRPERDLEIQNAPDPRIADFADNYGALYAFNSEKAQARAAVINRFENVIGLSARKEMNQITEHSNGGVTIRAVYGPNDGGFSSMEDAVNMTEWALRDAGVSKDQIKLIRRDGSEYTEIPRSEYDAILFNKVVAEDVSGAKMTVSVKRKPSDILVAVDHTSTFRPSDVAQWAEASVKYNVFDRMFAGTEGLLGSTGSVQRHFVDIHSMLDPTITKSASVAVDRTAGLEKELLQLGEQFANSYSKADKDMKLVMDAVIKEANEKGINHSYTQLVAYGLRDSEIEAIKTWRQTWDTMYHLENRDAARTLAGRGYMEFVDRASDTRLFAKPVARQQVGKVGKSYDPTTGKVSKLSDVEVKALYDAQGTFGRLRQPMVVGDDAVEHIIVKNNAGSNFLKAITDDTQVLNYRKGYYSVHYTDPYFIVERVKNSRGEVLFERAVASGSDKKKAEAFAMAKANNEGKVFDDDYFVRHDVKKGEFSDDGLDLQQARGRSAQRVRGKRLEESDTNIVDPSMANILDPVDSLIVSSRSLATRTSMREMLETTKARFMSQYGEFMPIGQYGSREMPNNISEVIYRNGPPNKRKLADARTTFEYIKYLEDGYINHIDDAYKAVFKNIADYAGNVGLGRTDKFARWMSEGRGPSAMGKNIAFNLYLATNPARQFIVQGHQAVQLTANFPKWILSGDAVPQVALLTAKQLGAKIPAESITRAGFTEESLEAMYQQFKATGQVAAIDKQNLVRGSLLNMADQAHMGKNIVGRSWQIATMPLTWSRQIGFDAGENLNTMTSWLAHRDDAIRKGLDMSDKAVQADVSAKARNYTYNMNAAGDLPYNQNMLAAVFQFMQVPHKALLTMTTNRVLTPAQKIRLATFNSVMYTLPPAAMISWFGGGGLDILPEDGEARDLAIQGLEGYTFNKLLSLGYGSDVSIDWSGLAPMDMYGSMEFVHNLLTTDAGSIMSATPSGQLFFGNNPRITNFAKTAARFTNLIDDYEDPTTFGQVAMEFGKLSSGFSNTFKASYALEYGRKFGSLGGNTDEQVPTPQAIAMAFGFQSTSDALGRKVNDVMYNKSKDLEADVKEYYKQLKRHVQSADSTTQGAEYAIKMTNEAWRVWGNDNIRARRMLNSLIKKDLESKDAWMHKRLLEQADMFSKPELEDLAKSLKFRDEDQRTKYLQTIDYINSYKEE